MAPNHINPKKITMTTLNLICYTKKKKIKIIEIKTNPQSKQIKNENIQNLRNKTEFGFYRTICCRILALKICLAC